MSSLRINMRHRRHELGLTPTKAAAGAHMPVQMWKDIENGIFSPTLRELERISNVLRVAPHILAGWRPQKVGIMMRREGNDVVIEWDDSFCFSSSEVLAAERYIRIKFEEAEEEVEG